MGMTVTELEGRMTARELLQHAAEYRLTNAERVQAQERAKSQAQTKKGRL